MFLYSDPGVRLHLHHQRAEELHRAADTRRRAAAAQDETRHGRRMRWTWHGRSVRQVRAPVAP
ncbi:hypothetical protein [Krasilnikovia sp. MM14-A1259]|uniref:hypothetical protein n=1 Tax=Krasilnikovia sp. MM14-A1259 TaxID=3373539 RepID=UPI00382E5C9F